MVQSFLPRTCKETVSTLATKNLCNNPSKLQTGPRWSEVYTKIRFFRTAPVASMNYVSQWYAKLPKKINQMFTPRVRVRKTSLPTCVTSTTSPIMKKLKTLKKVFSDILKMKRLEKNVNEALDFNHEKYEETFLLQKLLFKSQKGTYPDV